MLEIIVRDRRIESPPEQPHWVLVVARDEYGNIEQGYERRRADELGVGDLLQGMGKITSIASTIRRLAA